MQTPHKPATNGLGEGRSAERHREIACLIPVYNGHSKLHRTLLSLTGQGVPLTVVLVDDGSSPPLDVDAFAYDYPITLLRMPRNGGIERALNFGLQHIVEEGYGFVARMDNGDICGPSRFRKQLEFLDANPDVALVGSHMEWISDTGAVAFRVQYPVEHRDIVRRMYRNSCIGHVTVMFRTQVVREIGVYSLDYPAAEDYEFFWRISRRFRVANVPAVLVQAHLDRSGISLSRRHAQLMSRLRIQAKYFNSRELHSYWGIITTLLLLATPNRMIIWLKGVLSRGSRRPGAAG